MPTSEKIIRDDFLKEGKIGTLKVDRLEVEQREKVLFSWKAPSRPFKNRNREFFTTILSIAALLGIIFFLIEGVMPVLVIVSAVFLIFVLSSVPPQEVEYEITNKNVVIGGKKYPLRQISRFWLAKRFGYDLLVFETPFRFPGRLELVVQGQDIEKLKETLYDYITFEEGTPTFLDKAASWFSKYLPIEE